MRRGIRSIGVFAVITLGLLSACSSSDDDSTNTTSGDDSGVDVAASQANVDAMLAEPTNVGVQVSLDEPPPTGITAIYLQCPVPECQTYGDGVNAATDALGWTLTRINFELTPESAQAAFDQAINESPDVIYSVAASPTWLDAQRQRAEDAGIVFIDFANVYEDDPTTAVGGYGDAVAPPDGLLQGADHVRFLGGEMADYAIVQTDGNVNALVVYIPDFPIGVPPAVGFADRLEEVCPETCKSAELQIAATDIGSTLPQKITSELQRDPSINYLMFISGSFATGVVTAISDLGMQDDVKIVGNAPIVTSLEEMVAGPVEQAWVGLNAELVGWRMVDMSIRVLQGQTIPEKASGPDDTSAAAWPPVQLLTADTYPDPVPYAGPEGYEDMFKTLWGIS